jgi:hypothetical protein
MEQVKQKEASMNWIYNTNPDNTVRFTLGTEGARPLICIGVNPSTATPDELDPTLRSVQKKSEIHGFDSWIMLNLYPLRATNPNELSPSPELNLHLENLNHINRIFNRCSPVIWVAWGNLITKRPYLVNCLEDIYKVSLDHPCKWITIGKESKAGHPHHPLYLSNSSALKEFDFKGYLEELKILS